MDVDGYSGKTRHFNQVGPHALRSFARELQIVGIVADRICMAFDALVVGFGLSRVLVELDLAASSTTYSILLIVVVLNSFLLFRFFRRRTNP